MLVGKVLEDFESSMATFILVEMGELSSGDLKIERVTARENYINQTIAVIQFQSLLENALASISTSLCAQFLFENSIDSKNKVISKYIKTA